MTDSPYRERAEQIARDLLPCTVGCGDETHSWNNCIAHYRPHVVTALCAAFEAGWKAHVHVVAAKVDALSADMLAEIERQEREP